MNYTTTKAHNAALALDLQHIWHPCSQMKDYERHPPVMVKSAEGCYLTLQDDRKIIDAISSWWCKSLGHNHPRLKQALIEQVNRFEHVMLANTTHDVIIELSQKLGQLMPPLDKVFYASDGSCAIEIAMKMSLHAHLLSGETQRTQFIALQNGYHGETVGALSISDVGCYRTPYASMLLETHYLNPVPYVSDVSDPLWDDCSAMWPQIEQSLAPYAHTATALCLEPLMQGAGGMLLYSRDFLRRLRAWTEEAGVHLIADEIMTGIGRTGKMLACMHADIIPDFICLSKGLTSGWLPLSAVLTRDTIYQLFYDGDIDPAFLHSHTFSGNALATRVALETLKIIEEEQLCDRAQTIGYKMQQHFQAIAQHTGRLTHIRGLGAIVAADLTSNSKKDTLALKIQQAGLKNGLLIRPLGNTLYWCPPLNIAFDDLEALSQMTENTINDIP